MCTKGWQLLVQNCHFANYKTFWNLILVSTDSFFFFLRPTFLTRFNPRNRVALQDLLVDIKKMIQIFQIKPIITNLSSISSIIYNHLNKQIQIFQMKLIITNQSSIFSIINNHLNENETKTNNTVLKYVTKKTENFNFWMTQMIQIFQIKIIASQSSIF